MSNKRTQNEESSTPEPRLSCRVTRRLKKRVERIAMANGMDVSSLVRFSVLRALPAMERPEERKVAA